MKQDHEVKVLFYNSEGKYEGHKIGETKKYLPLAIKEARRLIDQDRMGTYVSAEIRVAGKVVHAFNVTRM